MKTICDLNGYRLDNTIFPLRMPEKDSVMILWAEMFSADFRAFELRIFIETVVNNPERTMQKIFDEKI